MCARISHLCGMHPSAQPAACLQHACRDYVGLPGLPRSPGAQCLALTSVPRYAPQAEQPHLARQIFRGIVTAGFSPNIVTYCMLISGLSRAARKRKRGLPYGTPSWGKGRAPAEQCAPHLCASLTPLDGCGATRLSIPASHGRAHGVRGVEGAGCVGAGTGCVRDQDGNKRRHGVRPLPPPPLFMAQRIPRGRHAVAGCPPLTRSWAHPRHGQYEAARQLLGRLQDSGQLDATAFNMLLKVGRPCLRPGPMWAPLAAWCPLRPAGSCRDAYASIH